MAVFVESYARRRKQRQPITTAMQAPRQKDSRASIRRGVEWPLARLRDMSASSRQGAVVPQLAAESAARVTRLLTSVSEGDRLLTAAEVAQRFGVNRGWVYAHAGDLGVVRLGAGPRAPLRFDPATVAAYLLNGQTERQAATSVISVRDTVSRVPLLPIRHEPSRRRWTSRATPGEARV